MNITLVTAECMPYIASGDLAMDCLGMAKSLSKQNNQVSVFLPFYKQIKDNVKADFIGSTTIYIGDNLKYVGVLSTIYDGIRFYFIDNEEYFYHDKIYNHANDGERFAFFCDACLKAMSLTNNYPDILQLHDWPTGLIPYLLKSKYKYDINYRKIKTVLTIDNAFYQGEFPMEMEEIIDADKTPILYLDGKINFLKAGITEADYITTVSSSYQKETLNPSNYKIAYSLKDRLNEYQAIMHGTDYDTHSTLTDKNLYYNFDSKDIIEGKKKNKQAFKKEFSFDNTDCMLVGFVGYFNRDFGFELLKDVLEDLIKDTDCQFFFLGYGDPVYEQMIYSLCEKYPERIKAHIGDKPEILARKVFISSDLLLAPFHYASISHEQLSAMHYGTIPFIHEINGLKDVEPAYNEYTGEGLGFSFENENKEDFMKVFNLAYGMYRFNQQQWYQLVEKNTTLDISWDKAAKEYLEIYNKIKY